MLDSQTLPNLSRLSLDQKRELLELLEAKERLRAENKIREYYPASGPLRRELYPRHMEFFSSGATHRERCFMAGNRVGKTEGAGGYETVLHLTGDYPDWWEGKRFTKPIVGWAAGDTNETTRDIIQRKLVGPHGYEGTGLIPKSKIIKTTPRSGIPGAILDIYIEHVSGGTSVLTLKSYEQGRKKFQGTEIDLVWLDEEPPEDVYSECVTRTMTTGGIVYLTFTPLEGLSNVVKSFLPKEYQLSA